MHLATKEEKIELKKHINAIHCANNLTLVQRKLFNALLFNAYSDLPHKQRFAIQIRELCRLIGYYSNDYAKLKHALLGLITLAIEWDVIDHTQEDVKKWQASSILASAELANGNCIYEYSHVLKELLYRPEVYGRIDIRVVSKFKSGYGLALYENCIRYQGLNHTPWFTIEVFRKLMGVLGDKYDVFKDFKKRVINIAVTEVNALAPIKLFPEIERKNQQVTRIRFKLNQVVIKDQAVPIKPLIDQELTRLLSTTFNFSQSMIDDVLSKYDENYIKEKVQLIIKSDAFLSGRIRGLAGYLTEALKKDYKVSKSSQIIVNELKDRQEAEKKASRLREEGRIERYSSYIAKKVNAFISSFTKKQHERLTEEFEGYLKQQNRLIQTWYKEKGVEHVAIKGLLNNFIKDTYREQLGKTLSYEEFSDAIDN